MKIVAIIMFCIVFLSTMVVGQDGIIQGNINLEGSEQSIADVYIYLDGTSFFAISNARGQFQIKDVPAGNYTLKTSALGYLTVKQNVEITTNSKITTELTLKESINDLPTVEINAQNGTGGLLGALELSGSTHYISKKELNEINSSNVHDILQNVPGIQLQEEDGFGLRPNIGLRGTGSERSSKITIMEDGILAAPAPYAAPSAYYFPTVARMEAIEIMKGASQIKYGPFTTGGVINFISTSIPKDFGGSVKLGFGNFGMRQIKANIGDKLGGFSYLIEALQIQSDGFKKINNTDENTGFDKKDWIAKIKWEGQSKDKVYHKVEFKYGESREISHETYLGISRQDFKENPYHRYAASQKDLMTTKHRQFSLKYIINPVKNLYVQGTAYHSSFFRNWYKLDKIQNEDGSSTGIASLLSDPEKYANEFSLLSGRTSLDNEFLQVKANNRNYISRGIQSKVNYFLGNHSIEMGFRSHYDEMDRFQWVDEYQMSTSVMELVRAGNPGTESNRIESALASSFHLKYELSLSKFSIELGVRSENIKISRIDFGKEDTERTGADLTTRTNDVKVIIPGAAMKFDLDQANQLFAGIHRGFSPPVSTPETQPELSINYELGYRIQKSTLFGSLVLFRNDYSNLLGADLASSGGSGSGDLFNGGASVAQGVELALSYRKPIGDRFYIPVRFQYTFTDAFFATDFESEFEPWGSVSQGDELPYLAKNTFNIRTGWSARKYQLYFSTNYMGAMRTSAGQNLNEEYNIISDRTVFNIDCSFSLNKNTQLNFAIHNLANKAYIVANRPAGYRPGAPRSYSVSLNARF